MTRILVVGYGSIGRRHAHLLKQLGDVEVALLRRSSSLPDTSGMPVFRSPEESLVFRPQGVIVCNPTSCHVESALFFSERGIPALIEKPVAHASQDANKLRPFQDLLRVAYVMRFSALHRFLVSLHAKERIFKASFRRSFYLPKWHPHTDYRHEYVASRLLGGGCVRTLSHEIDLALAVFGQPDEVFGFTDKLSDLDMDCDDAAFLSMRYAAGMRVDIALDLFSPSNVFDGLLHTARGTYEWDLRGVRYQPRDAEEREQLVLFGESMLDHAYRDQLLDFVRFVQTGDSSNATLQDGLGVLNVIEGLKSYAF